MSRKSGGRYYRHISGDSTSLGETECVLFAEILIAELFQLLELMGNDRF